MTLRTPLTLSAIFVSALGLAAAAGCSGGAKEAPAETKSVTQHTCTRIIAKKAVEYKGTANGDDQAKVEEAAWADVCAKLPEADRPNCKDESKFMVMKSGGSANAGAGTSYNTNITLTSKHPQLEGKSESETSKEEACKAALLKACEAAGEKGDCIADGKFESQGEMSSSKTSKVSAK
jgi:hypothetical protein